MKEVTAKIISTDAPTEAVSNTATGTLSLNDSNPYNTIKAPVSAPKIFETYAPVVLKTHTDKIAEYNTKMKTYTDVLDGIKDKNTPYRS